MILLSLIMLYGLYFTIKRDYKDPLNLFFVPWTVIYMYVYTSKGWIVLDDFSIFIVYLFIIVVMYIFLPSQLTQKNTKQVYILHKSGTLITLITFGLIITYIILIMNAIQYSRGIVAFALESRQAQMTDAQWPGILSNTSYFRILKNTMSFGFPTIAILLILGRERLAMLLVLLLSAGFLVTGERWGAFVAVIMLLYNRLLLTERPVKLLIISVTTFVALFSLGSVLRDRVSFVEIFNDLLVYTSGGVIAFSHMLSGSCYTCYTPPTFRYISSMIGLTPKSTDIVGDKVYINSMGDWTNTFSMFGSLYFYFGLTLTFLTITLFLALLRNLYRRKHKPVYRMYLLMLVPAAPLSVFTDAFLSSAPYLLRGFLFSIFLIRFRWDFR